MATLGSYTVHPFADAFPLIDGDEFDELVTNIKLQGQRQPIVITYEGDILVDGRNRWRACEAAGVKPRVERLPGHYTESMILDYIVSTNMARRHLNPGQRAMVALAYESAIAEAIKAAETARKAAAPATSQTSETASRADLRTTKHDRSLRSDERAAKAVGASGRAVQQAKAVQRDTPDLADKVRRGEIALDAADKERKRRVAAMPKPEPAPKPSKVMLTLRTHTGEEFQYPKPSGAATFNQTSGAGISWAEWSWNPVTGCLHGCDYCYARELASSERLRSAYPAGFTPLFHPERLDAPANTVIPAQYRDPDHTGCNDGTCKICAYRRVFVCSMADLYGRWVPEEWIKQVHESCIANPQWDYIHLTKFPDRYVGLDFAPTSWVGTSVDEQKRVRIAERAFRQIDGVAVKWLSLEPLKEPLEFSDLSMFDWVVIGAQTATRQPSGYVPAFAPPFEWVARIALQAIESGCKVHFKPNLTGKEAPGMTWPDQYPDPGQRAQH